MFFNFVHDCDVLVCDFPITELKPELRNAMEDWFEIENGVAISDCTQEESRIVLDEYDRMFLEISACDSPNNCLVVDREITFPHGYVCGMAFA